MKITFPSNFLWGSSISSYQVEGSNFKSDWYLWEKKNKLEEAGLSTNHYQLFPQDFSLARFLGHNALRFSIEWSRLFPTKGSIEFKEIEHYLKVVENLRKNGLTPLVGLHHFTNPIWFAKEGGWLNTRCIDYFLDYTKVVVSKLKEHVTYWITFNEPLVYLYNGFVRGTWPPGFKSLKLALKALKNILKAHSLAYQEIKSVYNQQEGPFVFIAKHMRIFSPCFYLNFSHNNFLSFLRSQLFNFKIIDFLLKKRCLDFIGLNYYCREFVQLGKSLLGQDCKKSHHPQKRHPLGCFIYPEGLYKILIKLKKYRLPIIITENGTAASQDYSYKDYLHCHLKSVSNALKEGVDIRGYMWWSLIDNFEWNKGFNVRFGLIRVNFNNFSREIRPFALHYKNICEENEIDI